MFFVLVFVLFFYKKKWALGSLEYHLQAQISQVQEINCPQAAEMYVEKGNIPLKLSCM